MRPGMAWGWSRGHDRVLRPLALVRRIWTHAVADDGTVRFNVRLLTALTAVFSLPGIAQGIVTMARAPTGLVRGYGAYILALGLLELAGALLLTRHAPGGRRLIMVAAAGFYVEAALGLAGLERDLLAVVIVGVCAPAEAWVLWFLCHPRVRAYVATWRA